MDLKKNISTFKEFVKTKYKFAQLYSNQMSKFSERDFRKNVFKVKSDLSHDFEKDEMLYIPINFGRAITGIYTDYVIGMGFSADFKSDEINNKFIDIADSIQLQKTLNEGVDIMSSVGYGILRVRKRDNDEYPRVEIIPLSNYCANMEGLSIGDGFEDIKEHFVYTIIKEENGNKYFSVDRYEKVEGGWIGYYGEKWKYNMNFVLTDRVAEGEEEPLKYLPLFIFNNDLVNIHSVEENDTKVRKVDDFGDIPRYFHQSDYVDLSDLFQEINDRSSQISVEYIKNLTSKMSVPASFNQELKAKKLKNKDGFVESPDFITHNVGETPAQYILKDATYVQTSINDWLPYVLKLIAVISKVPASLLGASLYGATSSAPVGTTEKEFSLFYARVEKKQLELYNQLQKLFRYIMYCEGVETVLPTIKFKKPTAYDIAERTNTAIQQMNAGIMSKESAIAFSMGYDDQEVKEELAKIEQETVDAYARDGYLKDTFNNNTEEDESTTA